VDAVQARPRGRLGGVPASRAVVGLYEHRGAVVACDDTPLDAVDANADAADPAGDDVGAVTARFTHRRSLSGWSVRRSERRLRPDPYLGATGHGCSPVYGALRAVDDHALRAVDVGAAAGTGHASSSGRAMSTNRLMWSCAATVTTPRSALRALRTTRSASPGRDSGS